MYFGPNHQVIMEKANTGTQQAEAAPENLDDTIYDVLLILTGIGHKITRRTRGDGPAKAPSAVYSTRLKYPIRLRESASLDRQSGSYTCYKCYSLDTITSKFHPAAGILGPARVLRSRNYFFRFFGAVGSMFILS